MKKLFLYIAIAIILYVSAYEISNYFFRQEVVPNTIDVASSVIDSFADTVPVDKEKVRNIIQDKDNDKINSRNSNIVEKHYYIVGEKNGYVIVYQDYVGEVFDYTDVKMDVLKNINVKIYNMVRDNIVFDNKEDLYRFLQTISS